jgi:hypothetical protein
MRQIAEQRAIQFEQRAESEAEMRQIAEQRAIQFEQRAESEKLAREKLAAKLRELNIDPDSI